MINIHKISYSKEDEEKWDCKVTHRELRQYWYYSRLQVDDGYYLIIKNGDWVKNRRSLPNT